MKVVLLQNVAGLGEAGEVKEVADGYGRNFLLPKGLAEFASPSLLKRAEEQRHAEERRQLTANAGMTDIAQTLEGLAVTIRAKIGAQDRLYGAITSGDIAEEVQRLTGQDIDKRKIELDEPIHQLGEYEVTVRLTKELVPKLKVIVAEEPAKSRAKAKAKPKKEEKAEEVAGAVAQAMTEATAEATAEEKSEEKD
ncbi:MAG: 50S ribosomal protein L9 [Dehalococcoidia bacterium]|nr:50S ribosomal protein L9 [Dehalococcoidia bacterium]